jgi:hypothetical protein
MLTDIRGSEKRPTMAPCKDGNESSSNVKCGEFLDWNKKCISLPRRTMLH